MGIVMSKFHCFWFFLWAITLPAIAFELVEPPRSQVISVSGNAQALGVNLSIRKFTSTLNIQEILGFYQKNWDHKGVKSQLAPWQMLGIRSGNKFYNVQVQSSGKGSWGYLSISDLVDQLEQGKTVINSASKFPAMSNSDILDRQQQSDLLNDAHTTVLANRFSIAANSQFYLNHFNNKGWDMTQDSEQMMKIGRVILFNRGRKTLSITLNRQRGITYIVANLSKKKRL